MDAQKVSEYVAVVKKESPFSVLAFRLFFNELFVACLLFIFELGLKIPAVKSL